MKIKLSKKQWDRMQKKSQSEFGDSDKSQVDLNMEYTDKSSGMTFEQAVKDYIRSSGPATFKSIYGYFLGQSSGIERHHIVDALNVLLSAGDITLYHDGESFV
jgi:hypothetical protein